MSATKYESLIAAARFHLIAARGSVSDDTYKTDKFWSDDELLSIAKRGTTDLWAGVIDLDREHFLTVDVTNVTLDANATQLTGVPLDTFRVYLIEPRDTSDVGQHRWINFVPRDYNHPDFISARSYSASSTLASLSTYNGLSIYYMLSGQGAPNGAPIIRTAPMVSAQILLRFAYVPVLGVQTYTLQSNNPIPGESDNALIAWIVAYARGKERDDRSPDPAWIAVYATEKQSLLTRMTPRQSQEPEVVDGIFDYYWR